MRSTNTTPRSTGKSPRSTGRSRSTYWAPLVYSLTWLSYSLQTCHTSICFSSPLMSLHLLSLSLSLLQTVIILRRSPLCWLNKQIHTEGMRFNYLFSELLQEIWVRLRRCVSSLCLNPWDRSQIMVKCKECIYWFSFGHLGQLHDVDWFLLWLCFRMMRVG